MALSASIRSSKSSSCVERLAAGLAALLVAAEAAAFSGIVVPARFELKARPGEVLRQVVEIGNEGLEADEFAVRTADWGLSPQGGVTFVEEQLAPGSCRPWVRIERHTLAMPARSSRRFRFEVHVPPDAPAQECRFALLVSSTADKLPEVRGGSIVMPLQGRIGVIVYVAVGDVAPKLAVKSVALARLEGKVVPMAQIENSGTAHGRADGVLTGTDGAGKRLEFIVSNFPILPGETRGIPIWPTAPEGQSADWVPPLRLRGNIEWPGGRFPVDLTLEAP